MRKDHRPRLSSLSPPSSCHQRHSISQSRGQRGPRAEAPAPHPRCGEGLRGHRVPQMLKEPPLTPRTLAQDTGPRGSKRTSQGASTPQEQPPTLPLPQGGDSFPQPGHHQPAPLRKPAAPPTGRRQRHAVLCKEGPAQAPGPRGASNRAQSSQSQQSAGHRRHTRVTPDTEEL